MKKLLCLMTLLLWDLVQINAQLETETKVKRERQQIPKVDASGNKAQLSEEYKRLKNKPMVVDTSDRIFTIKVLTSGSTQPNLVITASHRAQYNGGTEPENSMEAVKALQLGTSEAKADIVELDIKMSKDSIVYVMHDDYLQRTTDFLDKFPGVGQGNDGYGHYNNYTWAEVSSLTLRKPDFSYTDRRVPLFRDVLRYVKNETSSLINLDIGNMDVFRAVWDIVKEEDAFHVCIFKTKNLTVRQYNEQYFNPLSAAQKNKVIFFPMITPDHPGYKSALEAYNDWENTCTVLTRCLAKGYELGYRKDANENTLLEIVKAIRLKNRVRVHVFNTYPDTYEGRYKGNENIGQCCNDVYDSRGDWNYLLDPGNTGTYTQGVNGYIITDDPATLAENLTLIGKRPNLSPQKN